MKNTTFKRLLAVLLALSLLCMLAACGTEPAPEGTVNPPAAQTPDTETPTETTPETSDEQPALSFGTSTGNTYENKSLGIGIRLDENWTFADDKELADLAGVARDLVSDDVAKALENATVVYDLYASKADGTNIIVNYQNIGAIYGALLTESNFVDLTIDSTRTSLEAAGTTVVDIKKQTYTIGGKQFYGLAIHSIVSEIDCYQAMLCIKAGSYMSAVAITSTSEATVNDLLNSFYLI